MKRTATVLFLLILTSLSCSKKSDPSPNDYLTQGRGWLLTLGEIEYTNGAKVNSTPTGVSCLDDNVLLFQADGTFLLDENLKICANFSKIRDSGTWRLSSDGKTLNVKGSATYDYDVLTLTAQTLVLERKEYITPQSYTRYRYSYRVN